MFPFRSPVRRLGAGSVCGLWDQYSPLEIKSAHVLVEGHSSSNNPQSCRIFAISPPPPLPPSFSGLVYLGRVRSPPSPPPFFAGQ